MSGIALPFEILDEIFLLLSKRDIASFRQVCRTFGAAGQAHMFREISLVVTPWSIARVFNIAFDPFLAKHVRTLRISCYLKERCRSLEHFSPTGLVSIEHCGEKFPHVLSAYAEELAFISTQESLVGRDKQYKEFATRIAFQLPNLSLVEISSFPSQELLPLNFKPHLALGFTAETFYGGMVRPLTQEVLAPSVLDGVLTAIFARPKCMKSKTLTTLKYDYLPSHLLLDGVAPMKGASMLRGLTFSPTKTEFQFGQASDPNQTPVFRDGSLRDFLATATALERLDLTLFPALLSPYAFDHHSHWPHLTHLRLARLTLDVDHMVLFFQRTGQALRSLQLFEVRIKPTAAGIQPCTTLSFFEQIRSDDSLPNLQHFATDGVLRAGSDEAETRAGGDWTARFPTIVPPGRALRYLMCGRKTDMQGEEDAVSAHPYEWDHLSWDVLRASIQEVLLAKPH